MKRIFFSILIALITNTIHAQQEAFSNFGLPVNFQIQLSGNFSEPRASHFHSGIDIRTYADGKPLYALADMFPESLFHPTDTDTHFTSTTKTATALSMDISRNLLEK